MNLAKKKILIIGPAWPLRGGLSTYDQILAEEFQNDGHEVCILTFKLQYPNFLFPGKTQLSEDAAPLNLNIEVELNSINPFNWIRLGYAYKKRNYDLVVLRYWLPFMAPCLGTLARIIRKNGKSRVVAITDNILPHEKRVGDKVLTKYFLASCHGFVAMSNSVLNDLRQWVSNKPTLYNPHPLYNSFKPAIPKTEALELLQMGNHNYLLFFGFIRAYKGLDLLLDAFAKVDRAQLDLKLLVVGEFYENEAPYMDLASNLGLISDVTFIKSFVPDSEVHLYFSMADCIIQPYKEATQSGVTQIAYFYDKPMIVTNVGGLPELVPNEKAGYVVERDAEAIAEAISRFYHESKAIEMTEFVKIEKEKYSWRKMKDSLWSAGSIHN